MHAIPTDDRKTAYVALRTVLHALRDRLPLAPAVGLGAQLPLLLRGVYYDGWQPGSNGKPEHVRNLDEFLRGIEGAASPADLDGEMASRAVFHVLEQHLDPNETEKIIHLLPRHIQQLWRGPAEPRDT
jgi:uncharacterized protein (DUF2267 family)